MLFRSHVAANMQGDVDVLRLLLDKGADLHAVNNDGLAPLLLALRHAHYRQEANGRRLYDVAALLLARGALVKGVASGAELPLRAAMDPVNLPLIMLLLNHGAAIPDEGLDWAIANEYTDLIRSLMARATPGMLGFKDSTGGTLLHRAATKSGTQFVMEWLVGKRFDVNALDNDRLTPFGHAALAGNVPGMTYLASVKAKMDTIDADGQTALHLAAYGARHEVLQWLIAKGYDVKSVDKQGRTPLMIAIDTHRFAYYTEARKLELIALLGGVPGDIVRGRYSDHPLHAAVRAKDIRTIERLLESGAGANLKDESGDTPLYWAIQWCSTLATPNERAFGEKLLPLLIRHGADTTLRKGANDETYDQFARGLRLGDLLERTKQRHAPTKR
mgnify:CR=1 FL=1